MTIVVIWTTLEKW